MLDLFNIDYVEDPETGRDMTEVVADELRSGHFAQQLWEYRKRREEIALAAQAEIAGFFRNLTWGDDWCPMSMPWHSVLRTHWRDRGVGDDEFMSREFQRVIQRDNPMMRPNLKPPKTMVSLAGLEVPAGKRNVRETVVYG